MTTEEYKKIRDDLETRYRDGMAALEQLYTALTGSNPPDSPIALASSNGHEERGLRSAESLGIPPAAAIDQRTAGRTTRLSDDAKAKKKAYMKAYWQKRKREKSA